MADRTKKKQSLHDRAVEEVADEFSSSDVTVKADHISKYDQPEELNNEIPDILVIDGGSKRAFEIETEPTDDKTQRENLREWAENHRARMFRWAVIQKDGSLTDWKR